MLSKFLPLVLFASMLAAACSTKDTGGGQAEVGASGDRHRIDSLEKVVVAHTGDSLEQQYVLELLRQYQNYTVDYPKDSATADYLLKSGKIYYEYLRDIENSEEYLNRLIDSFPKAPQRPVGLLLLGNAYHDIGDTSKAIDALYILEREYANTQYSGMAQDLIRYIRRTAATKPPGSDLPPPGQEPKI